MLLVAFFLSLHIWFEKKWRKGSFRVSPHVSLIILLTKYIDNSHIARTFRGMEKKVKPFSQKFQKLAPIKKRVGNCILFIYFCKLSYPFAGILIFIFFTLYKYLSNYMLWSKHIVMNSLNFFQLLIPILTIYVVNQKNFVWHFLDKKGVAISGRIPGGIEPLCSEKKVSFSCKEFFLMFQ